jgi:hypothetical protein
LPLIPIATFTAGSLLTLLLPVGLLIALTVWYWKFSEGVPATTEADIHAAPAAGGQPAQAMGNPGMKPQGSIVPDEKA